MELQVINPGLLTTVQDLGRTGYQSTGFSVSGALDQRAMKIANILVGNEPGEAVMEMTLMGATFEFNRDCVIAVTGANMEPKVNGVPIPMYAAVGVKAGDTLAFGFAKTGCRAYLAFANGMDLPRVMGSKSTNLKCGVGGYQGRKLAAGDTIDFIRPMTSLYAQEDRVVPEENASDPDVVTLRVVMGPQDDYFTAKGIQTFLAGVYTVSTKSDRMGRRLEGPAVEAKDGVDIVSDGMPYGGVQIPSSGQPIIMLSDRQTTGGYAKIATVASVDIPKLVQRRPEMKVHFQEVSVEEAQRLYCREQKELEKLVKKMKCL